MSKVGKFVGKCVDVICQELHAQNIFLIFIILTIIMWTILYMACPIEMRMLVIFCIAPIVYLHLEDINKLFKTTPKKKNTPTRK